MPFLKMRIILRKRNWAARAPECPPRGDFDWGLPCQMRDKEVHGKVLTVHVLVHHLPYCRVHCVGVYVAVVLVVEGSSSKNHTQLATVVAVVVPGVMLPVPSMESARKTNKSLSIFAPHAEPKDYLIVSKVGIIIHRENGFSFNLGKGKKSVIEAVLLCSYDKDGNSNIWPLEVFSRRIWTVPDDQHLVQIGQPIQPCQGVEQHLFSFISEHHHCELLLRAVTPKCLGKLCPSTPFSSLYWSEPKART